MSEKETKNASLYQYPDFRHTKGGMTRFPPNIEQLLIDVDGCGGMKLIARRNDIVLEFSLNYEDRCHLIERLSQDTMEKEFN